MSIITFLHTKARAFVVFLFSVISLGVLVLSTLLATAVFQKWYGLVVGVVLMLCAIPFHWIGKTDKWGYLLSFLLNTVANGFSVSAYYLSKSIPLDPYSLLLAAVPAAGVLLLVYLMLQIFGKTKKITVTVACVLNALLTIALAVLWVLYGSVLFSFGFFCSLLSFFYLCVFGITVNHDERSVLRDVSFGSFGTFIILTVVVIFVLSEGDILDGLDFDIGGDGKRKKKK